METSEPVTGCIETSKWDIFRAAIFIGGISIFLYFYLDARVPEPIPEKWKVKVMDAMMKTYGHTISWLVYFGLTEPFSDLDRKISDWFVLTMMTGKPWGLGYDSRLLIQDTTLAGVRVKIYQPIQDVGKEYRPALIYLHGGGWTLLSVDSYDPLMRKIARESGVVIISVDYRRSPQHPFPEPLNDCLEVFEYVIENYDELGLNPHKIAIGGDSAGGNMAAAITLRHKSKVAMQLLLVPSLQFSNWRTSSMLENSQYLNKSINNLDAIYFVLNYLGADHQYKDAFLANNHTTADFKKSQHGDFVDQSIWMPRKYVRDEKMKYNLETTYNDGHKHIFNSIKDKIVDPLLAPMLADDESLENLPYTYIMTAGYDILRDDGIMFYERLSQLGENAHLSHFDDGFHNAIFFPHGPLRMGVAIRIVDDIVLQLKRKLK
ncbi:hypothetical protein FSP39_022847 [Pinctada imbricata]|uniref:Alpha/beta hydrolase fold-3 domain-containing protein n=1 Tax=Pinctada imbricata TaxID=66713 RepID=A0AA89BJS3_PINIB|nr:hypothetical protein FSP39_022847 [Pinctada imbricata]